MSFLTDWLHIFNDPGFIYSLMLLSFVLAISALQRLGIGRELIFSSLRGFLQLSLVGLALLWIIAKNEAWLIISILFFMILLAGRIVSKRGKSIPNGFLIASGSLLLSSSITLSVLVYFQTIPANAQFIIPLGGMIIGNSMNGASLALNRLDSELRLRHDEILVYLSLGATTQQAVHKIIQSTLKASLIPAVDTMKTLGVIFMPGVMTGMIIAGQSPLLAVRFQLVVMFMLVAAATITNLLVLSLSYRQFFHDHTPRYYL